MDLNDTELIVLNQLLHAHYYPPEGPFSTIYVDKGEEVNQAKIRTAFRALVAAEVTEDELVEADERLRELVGAGA
jgi:hypothetical protein